MDASGYQPIHFSLQELVDPATYEARGHKAWELLDPRMLQSLDALREQFGPLNVNDWHRGGRFSLRGFRPMTATTGAVYSQHKFGRAIDCQSTRYTAETMRRHILAHPEQYPYITALERDVSWLHFDVRNHQVPQRIILLSP